MMFRNKAYYHYRDFISPKRKTREEIEELLSLIVAQLHIFESVVLVCCLFVLYTLYIVHVLCMMKSPHVVSFSCFWHLL